MGNCAKACMKKGLCIKTKGYPKFRRPTTRVGVQRALTEPERRVRWNTDFYENHIEHERDKRKLRMNDVLTPEDSVNIHRKRKKKKRKREHLSQEEITDERKPEILDDYNEDFKLKNDTLSKRHSVSPHYKKHNENKPWLSLEPMYRSDGEHQTQISEEYDTPSKVTIDTFGKRHPISPHYSQGRIDTSKLLLQPIDRSANQTMVQPEHKRKKKKKKHRHKESEDAEHTDVQGKLTNARFLSDDTVIGQRWKTFIL